MTPKKAKAAAQLAAAQYGRAQRKASELIMFWFDSETVSPVRRSRYWPARWASTRVRAKLRSLPSTGHPTYLPENMNLL